MCTSLFVTPYGQAFRTKTASHLIDFESLLKVSHHVSGAIFCSNTFGHFLHSHMHLGFEREGNAFGEALCRHLLKWNRRWASASLGNHLWRVSIARSEHTQTHLSPKRLVAKEWHDYCGFSKRNPSSRRTSTSVMNDTRNSLKEPIVRTVADQVNVIGHFTSPYTSPAFGHYRSNVR
jgi:hypothetical protein